ncbi:hypothetical protein [Legionella shakespearei]|nr:hypothetical protein [Legionella shakespearei]
MITPLIKMPDFPESIRRHHNQYKMGVQYLPQAIDQLDLLFYCIKKDYI